jgi:ferrous-iron efflux pump FieF
MSEAASSRGETLERVGTLMRRATYASIAVASLLVVAKLGAWIETNSVSLLSSLIDSLLDGAASLANLIAVHQALVPPDREHRFGHGKAEPLASLGQAAFIAGSALLLLIEAIQHLIHPQPITNTHAGLAVMIFAVVVTLVLVVYQRSVVKRTGSLVVSVDAFHYRADLVLNFAVIAALLLTVEFGYVLIDPIFGGAIALWIIWGAWQVVRRAIVQLMDHELPDVERERIRAIALAHPEVRAVHDMKTRTAGPISFIQIHLEMDGSLPLTQAHRIADEVEASILAAYPRSEVIIHQDPAGVDEPRAAYTH